MELLFAGMGIERYTVSMRKLRLRHHTLFEHRDRRVNTYTH